MSGLPTSQLGGAGAVGGGGYSLQTSATATSKLDSQYHLAQDERSGAGNRGFINNFAGPGSTQVNSQNASDTDNKGLSKWWLIGGAAVVGLLLWRKKI